jgi:hypothetical protein
MPTLKQQIEEKQKQLNDFLEIEDSDEIIELNWEDCLELKSFLSQALKDIAIEAVKSVEVEKVQVRSEYVDELCDASYNECVYRLTAKKAEIIKSLEEEV